METNIVFERNDAFGNPDYNVIRALLFMVDMNLMAALDRPPFSTKQCVVIPTDMDPMCSAAGEKHLIFLNVKGDYWCQWVYQFAHEYCHHIIDGALSGKWSDLLWFEEMICELSSMYNLHEMVSFCQRSGLSGYAPAVQAYLDNLLCKNRGMYPLNAEGGWYKGLAASLKEQGYNRALYNSIAALVFPLFVQNPFLWKIILHIGDIRSWSSLEELFSHFKEKADDSYRDSLCRFVGVFE